MKEVILSVIQYVIGIVATFIIVIGIFLLISCIPETRYHYEYIDMDNNRGIAQECSYKFVGHKSGGQGSPVCELYDGTVKQVKEYKAIYDGTYQPIDEYFG